LKDNKIGRGINLVLIDGNYYLNIKLFNELNITQLGRDERTITEFVKFLIVAYFGDRRIQRFR
jgi:hypothetical protein